MEIVKRAGRMREIIRDARRRGESVGLVPTMGYLHEGHQSLLRRARDMTDRVVMSLFVNPMQFGPGEDLEKYPRDAHRDTEIATREGVDFVFMPEVRELYPEGSCTFVRVEGLEDRLCGASRPGHFRGVCTVVAKLFGLIRPDFAYFGEKDAQQLIIVERMVRDLNLDVEIVGCPTVREPDGLAMSSRNSYLSSEERAAATALLRGLEAARARFEAGETSGPELATCMRQAIESEPLARLDYAEVVARTSLEPVAKIDGPTLCAVAAWIGETRLIDNITLVPRRSSEA